MAGVASTIWTVGLRMSQKKAVPNDFIRVNKVASEGFAFILDKLKFIP